MKGKKLKKIGGKNQVKTENPEKKLKRKKSI